MNPLLRLDELVTGYPGRPLSAAFNLALPQGAGVGIIGANGSGKSTLLKTLAGLLPPVSGRYAWAPRTRCAYVPQEDHVQPAFPLTVLDVLKMGALPMLSRWRTSKKFEQAAETVLAELEILEFKNRLIAELSRGQRQRALIARALLREPTVLLLDEPYNALDDLFRKKLHALLEARRQRDDFSFFIIEHDLNRVINQIEWAIVLGPFATLYGDKATVINPHALSQAYGTRVHIHQDNNELQIIFL